MILSASTRLLGKEPHVDGPSSPRLSPREARRKLAGVSGKSLDETVVRTLLRLLDSEGENYAAAADERFALPGHPPDALPSDLAEGSG